MHQDQHPYLFFGQVFLRPWRRQLRYTPEQLELLHNLRAEFEKTGAVSAQSHICHLGGEAPDCMQHLFPSPLHAWRIAGLPNPGEEAKAYMSKN